MQAKSQKDVFFAKKEGVEQFVQRPLLIDGEVIC